MVFLIATFPQTTKRNRKCYTVSNDGTYHNGRFRCGNNRNLIYVIYIVLIKDIEFFISMHSFFIKPGKT